MSIQHCENCDQMIDTDFDAEHFEECEPMNTSKVTRVEK